jgi:hypothetical protein
MPLLSMIKELLHVILSKNKNEELPDMKIKIIELLIQIDESYKQTSWRMNKKFLQVFK